MTTTHPHKGNAASRSPVSALNKTVNKRMADVTTIKTMNEETMKQWNALISEYNKRNAEIIAKGSDELNKLEVEYRRTKADFETRKYEFMAQLKREQREATEKYIEECRQAKIRVSRAKRQNEAGRQEAYMKFKLEHQGETWQ